VSSDLDFRQLLPSWIEFASQEDVPLGLDPSEAFQRAQALLAELRAGQASAEDWALDTDRAEVLHALVALVCREGDASRAALRDIGLAFEFISALPWPVDAFGGPRELLAACVFQAWRTARRVAGFPRILSEAQDFADRLLSIPAAEWKTQTRDLALLSPEVLLGLCGTMWSLTETAPAMAREVAELFYLFY
jgi:hypothetical protein